MNSVKNPTSLRKTTSPSPLWILLAICAVGLACGAARADGEGESVLQLETRARAETPPGSSRFAVTTKRISWDPAQTAIVVIDMWDNHHCKAAARRVGQLAPAINGTLKAAREKGVLIVHSPADCMDFYQEAPQRKLAQSAPMEKAPVVFKWHDRDPKIELTYPDELTRDGQIEGVGSCTGCEPPCPRRFRNWTRQIDTLEIAPQDAITDQGQELYNLFRQRGIRHVIVMGVHANICMLGRPFGIRQMTYLGMDVVLCRDLTDSFFEPKTPGFNHFRGTDLIIEHTERYWCPTITSTSLTGRPPFQFPDDAAPVNPIARWSFEEPEGKLARETESSRESPITGNFRRRAGAVGTGLKCDGFSTRLVIPAEQAPRISGPLSIQAWFAPQAYPWTWCAIAARQSDATAGYSFRIDAEGHFGLLLAVDGKWHEATSTAKLPLMQWSHLAATFDPATGITLYLDGKNVGQLALTGTFTPAETDLWIARNRKKEPCAFEAKNIPVHCSLDGILDELTFHDSCLSPAEISSTFTATKPSAPPDLIPRRLPSGPAKLDQFGAFYTPLKYCEEWDEQWRGDGPDVVVAFDKAPFRLVCWRGISYAPCFVTEKGHWMSNEFVERAHVTGMGCCESMSDKQARFSHVKILENNAARTVIFWRNSPVGVNYQIPFEDPETGWGDWSEETYTVYPDGVAARKVTLWSGKLDEWHEWCQSLQILHPGQRPEDLLDPQRVMSIANMAGQSQTYGWEPGPRSQTLPALPLANIQVTYLNSVFNPFLILDDRDGINDRGGRGPAILRYGGSWSDFSTFPWRNHWPVNQVQIIGRYAVAADQVSQTYTATQYSAAYERSEKSLTKIMLCGLTDQHAPDLLPLAKSWLRPPALHLQGTAYHGGNYDPTQRAYLLERITPAAPLECDFAASPETPLQNFCLIVKNWGKTTPRLALDGQTIPPGKDFRIGHHTTIEGTDLIVWIERQSLSPVRLILTP
ncbi:MAG: LamG-like jellyroll fold domain-containing protein [Luteolibacter sp.]|jgi:nicotinamidase-related amidase|nr:LamG-like jellyroll fold domain-containing protein [Luteolibacter sp.]